MQTVETPIMTMAMTMADDNLNIASSFMIFIGENKARSFMSILYGLKVSYNQKKKYSYNLGFLKLTIKKY